MIPVPMEMMNAIVAVRNEMKNKSIFAQLSEREKELSVSELQPIPVLVYPWALGCSTLSCRVEEGNIRRK